MKSGYIVAKYDNMSGSYTCRRLVEEACACGLTLDVVGVVDTFLGAYKPVRHGSPIECRDFAILRYVHGSIKDFIANNVNRCFNLLNAFDIYSNKFEQISRIRSDALEIPAWLLGTPSHDFDILADYLGIPFVSKGLNGSMGREVNLVKCRDDFEKLAGVYGPERELLFESFVSSSFGRDIRVFVIDGEPIACMQRRSNGDFRANVALGAACTAWPIDEDITRAANDIFRITGLDYFGLDLLFGGQGYAFCEVNVMPGLYGIEHATGVNVAGEVVRLIRGELI